MIVLVLLAYFGVVIAGSSLVKKGQLSRRAYRVVSVLMGIGAVVAAVLYIRAMP